MHFPAGSGWSDQALAVGELLARRPGTSPTSTSEYEKTFGSGYTHDALRDYSIVWDAVAPLSVTMGQGLLAGGESGRDSTSWPCSTCSSGGEYHLHATEDQTNQPILNQLI